MTPSKVLTIIQGGRVRRTTRTCSIDECSRQHEAKGLCSTHYQRLRRGIEVAGPIRHLGAAAVHMLGHRHPRWTGDAVGYLGAHHRLYRARGPAKLQDCAHCGDQAKHWAYDHTDPNAKSARDGLYSTDVNRYMPLCASCHRIFDLAYAGESR